VVNGIGGALIFSTALAILTNAFPKEERGKVLGINVASTYLGLSIGPTIGGVLTDYWGWQSIFIVSTVLGISMIPFAMKRLQRDHHSSYTAEFDLRGSILYAAGLALIIYGFPKIAALEGVIYLLTGIALMVWFVRIENKVRQPLLNVNIFKGNQVFVYSNLAAFINYSATFALVFLMSFFLQNVKGMDARQAGIILMAQPVMMTVFSPLAGRLSDKVEPQYVASLGMGLAVVGLIAFIFLTPATPVWYIVLFQMILGLGFALFSSPNTNAVMSSVQPQHYGFASATLGTMRLTGQTVSMGISLMIIALMMGKTGAGIHDTTGLLQSIKLSFFVFAILCTVGVYFSMKRGKVRKAISK